MLQILVVEDDLNIRRLMCEYLRNSGYVPIEAGNGVQAIHILEDREVDMLITDIMMPDMDGFELTEQVRTMFATIPVLIVTAKEDFEDKRTGFLSGADDYMVKPIDMNEMLLRVQALLRRVEIQTVKKITVGKMSMDYENYSMEVDGIEIGFTKKEFELLFLLLSYTNKIFSRKNLLDKIWGRDTDSIERTIDVHINRIREKISHCKDIEIVTVKGLGYKVVRTTDAKE